MNTGKKWFLLSEEMKRIKTKSLQTFGDKELDEPSEEAVCLTAGWRLSRAVFSLPIS